MILDVGYYRFVGVIIRLITTLQIRNKVANKLRYNNFIAKQVKESVKDGD